MNLDFSFLLAFFFFFFRYIYFPCSRRQFGLPGPSLLEVDVDERFEDGTLASSLAVRKIVFAEQIMNIISLPTCLIMFVS